MGAMCVCGCDDLILWMHGGYYLLLRCVSTNSYLVLYSTKYTETDQRNRNNLHVVVRDATRKLVRICYPLSSVVCHISTDLFPPLISKMPVIVPVLPPPSTGLVSTTPKPITPVHEAKSNGQTFTPLAALDSAEAVDSEVESKSRIPTVRLDSDLISDALAAQLATSLVGHVLFLKNQVPL